jgi:hypothetical protein
MTGMGARRINPELRELVQEASRALTRLDADRLEELALCCQALNRGLPPAGDEARARLGRQSREAQRDMAIFARVLEASRDNFKVMRRLFEMRAGRLEYGSGWRWPGQTDQTKGLD